MSSTCVDYGRVSFRRKLLVWDHSTLNVYSLHCNSPHGTLLWRPNSVLDHNPGFLICLWHWLLVQPLTCLLPGVFIFTPCLVFMQLLLPVVHRMSFKMQTWLDPPLKMTSHCTQNKSQNLASSAVRESLLLDGSPGDLLSTQPAVCSLCSCDHLSAWGSHVYGLHQQVCPVATMDISPNTGAFLQMNPQKLPTGLRHITLLYSLLSISHYQIIVLFFTLGVLLLTEVGNLKF